MREKHRLLQVTMPLMACAVLLSGCGESARSTGWDRYLADGPNDRLTIQDLETPAAMRRTHPRARIAPPVHHRLVVQRMVFPRDAPRLKMAMSMIDDGEEDADSPRQRLWRANSLGIGRISRDRLGRFLAAIPEPLSVHAATIHNASVFCPLTLIDARGTQRVRLAGPGGQTETLELTGGEYQLLLKLTPPTSAPGSDEPPAEVVRLDLIPHHHDRTASLLPRSHREKIFDGTSFEDLRVAHSIDSQQVWIIWADLPPPTTEEDSDIEAGKNQESGDDASDRGESNPTPADQEDGNADRQGRDGDDGNDKDVDDDPGAADGGPLRLGEAMLTGRSRRGAVQVMLLIGVERP